MSSTRKLTVAFAAGRGLFGAALIAAPARLGTSWVGPDAERPPVHALIRGLGARDVALAAGTILAAARGAPLRPWLVPTAGCDIADLGATLAAGGAVPRRARLGTVALAGATAAAGAALAIGDP
jgi:hypothetical protein